MAVSKVDAANQIENQLPQANVANNVNFRNIIINGDMSIAQRSTSETGITSGDYHTVDRFQFIPNNMGTFTMSQDTDVPTGQGFSHSTKLECTVADASPAAGDYVAFYSRFEGQNLQYLKKGTSNAKSLTLSFWVKSAKTGTYIAELVDDDNSRAISKSYTIDTANTWEKKTITYAGDTTGTLDNDNNSSFRTWFLLGAGSTYTSGTLNTSWNSRVAADSGVGQVNLADTVGNDWYITGVQLEAGDTASDFEFLPFDVNLSRCQRYYHLVAKGQNDFIGMFAYYNSSTIVSAVFTPVTMRAKPSLDQVTGTDYYRFDRNNGNDKQNSLYLGVGNGNQIAVNSASASGTSGQAGYYYTYNTNSFMAFDSEL